MRSDFSVKTPSLQMPTRSSRIIVMLALLSLGGFVLTEGMMADNDPNLIDLSPQRASGEAWDLWHFCTIFIPRRSITGGLVSGLVLRRRVGRRWKYKSFEERPLDEDRQAPAG
jgi:hypothetical protein